MVKKILIVDDDIYILEAMEELLKYSGYEVDTTAKGDEVFNLTNKFQPDLILMDIMLSGMDGRDICWELKANLSTKNIPVIMISATLNVKNSVKQFGADDFVAKPFDIHDLLFKIEKQLAA
ncbi:MAG: response regulator [Sphingobacteriaceae bacterium]